MKISPGMNFFTLYFFILDVDVNVRMHVLLIGKDRELSFLVIAAERLASEPEASERSSSLIRAVGSKKQIFSVAWDCGRAQMCAQLPQIGLS